MGSKRASVYIPDHLESVLDLDAADGKYGLSNRLAAIIDRYGWIVSECPSFTRPEWCVMLDVCNGWASWSEAGETLMAGVALEVYDGHRLNRTGDKWDLSDDQVATLVDRLRNLSRPETMAVIERIERFWRRAQMDTDEAMSAAGIVPVEPADA